MSVLAAELLLWSAANIPVDDSSTGGGAIDTAVRPTLVQFSGNAVAAVISDGADTRTVTVTGRLTTGVIDTEVLTLNGTNEVLGVKTWERVLKIVASATSASRTVLFKQGTGGTTRGTISVNETTRHIAFQRSASAPSQKIRYEKHFWKNTNGSLALQAALVTLTADAASRIRIGLAPSAGDSATITNRLTAPSSVTFSDDNVDLAVPGTDLASGAAIGTWIEQTLPADDPAAKSTFTTKIAGTTI